MRHIQLGKVAGIPAPQIRRSKYFLGHEMV